MDNRDNIKILLLNLSNGSGEYGNDCSEVLQKIDSPRQNRQVIEVKEIQEAKSKLKGKEEYDVLIMCVGRNNNNSNAWEDLDNFLEEENKLYYLGFIVIFDYKNEEILQNTRKMLLRRIYPFFPPFEDDWPVIEAYIEERALYMKYQKSLDDLKKTLSEAKDLNNIVKNSVDALRKFKNLEDTNVTISLVDNKNEHCQKRYLLRRDDDLQQKKTIEFSEKYENFDRIAEDQRKKGVKCKLVFPLKIDKNNEASIIGTLHLSKYSEDQFSKVEKFALELFASQAARIISLSIATDSVLRSWKNKELLLNLPDRSRQFFHRA